MANILNPVLVTGLDELTAKTFFDTFGDTGDALTVIADLDDSKPPYKMKLSELVKIVMVKSNTLVEVGSLLVRFTPNYEYEKDGIIESCVRENTGRWKVTLSKEIIQGKHIILPTSCGSFRYPLTTYEAAWLTTSFSRDAPKIGDKKNFFYAMAANDDSPDDMNFTLKIYEKITKISQL